MSSRKAAILLDRLMLIAARDACRDERDAALADAAYLRAGWTAAEQANFALHAEVERLRPFERKVMNDPEMMGCWIMTAAEHERLTALEAENERLRKALDDAFRAPNVLRSLSGSHDHGPEPS